MDANKQAPVAFITGASYGVGAASALALAKAGRRIAISATRVDNLANTISMLKEAGVSPFAVKLDLGSTDSIEGAIASIMREAHRAPGLYQKAGEFPTATDPEFPMAEGAVDFYKNGLPFLSRYLPYWIVGHVQRLLAVMFTIIAIILPLNNYLPKLYGWFVKSYMAKLYRRLRGIEIGLQTELTAPQVTALQTELESIDRAASILPMRHSDLFLSIKGLIIRTRTELATRLTEVRSQTAKVT